MGIVPYKMPSSVELADATLKELDDLQADPTEMRNIYGQPGTEEIIKDLKAQLTALQEQYNDPVRFSPERDKE